jgi:hypothetical protein
MSEPNYVPPGSPVQGPADASAKGSLGFGIVLAWCCLIGGYFVCGIVVSAFASAAPGIAAGIWPLFALAPWILMIVLAVRYGGRGQSRTALGIGVGVASIFGVALLLVAACFGLLATSNFH